MTDAYIPDKNETDCAEHIEKTNQKVNLTVYCEELPATINKDCGCNETANPNLPQSSEVNAQYTNSNTALNVTHSAAAIQDCLQNNTSNCTETRVKSKDNQDSDTVLKYVFKKDENNSLPDKSKGHAKNSITRRKRSINKHGGNTRYAESVPLIVNYKTSHSSVNADKPFERIRGDVIKNSDLADFNIETLHENSQSHKNNEAIKNLPNKIFFLPKIQPRLHEEITVRTVPKDYPKNNKPYKISEDIDEVSVYKEPAPPAASRQNSKPFRQREDVDEQSDFRENRKEPPRERDSKTYDESVENDEKPDYKNTKEPHRVRVSKPRRESEETEKIIDYRDNRKEPPRDSKPYRESDESDDRSDYRDTNKEPIDESDKKRISESEENDERNDYTNTKKLANRGHDRKHYRESEEDDDDDDDNKSDYRDNRKESHRERDSKPYRESEESDEINNYRDTRKEPLRERDSKPYHESDESDERSDYRDSAKVPHRDRIPYREREEGDESSDYRNTRKEPLRERDSKHNRESDERDERSDYRDSAKVQYRERDSKPYRESEESDGKSDYRDIKKEHHKQRNNKPYRDSNESGERSDYRESQRQPQGDRGSIESGEKYYPRSKASYSASPEDNSESREDDSTEEPAYPRNNYANNRKEYYSAPPKDSRESREGDHNKESSYPKRAEFRDKVENKDYYDKENNKSDYIKPRGKIVDSDQKQRHRKDENSSYQKQTATSPSRTESNYYKRKDGSNFNKPATRDESEEEEAIIAIMKKKSRKAHENPRDKYKSDLKDQASTTAPVKIRDVDLDDFSYERIQVNDQGKVETAKDTHENYDTDSQVEIAPITTSLPLVVRENVEQYSRSIESIDTPLSSEVNDDDKSHIHINDGEVKPVVEINSNSDELHDENSNEALKTSPDNEDTSLETLLGVKLSDANKPVDKKMLQLDSKEKGDVKQQFERIPVNYNHAKTEQKQDDKDSSSKSVQSTDETDDDDTAHNQGTLDILTPKDHNYDDNLNIKFDDLTIKLPEIKLPKDILAYEYEEPAYEKQTNEDKPKFYQYSDDYKDEKPRQQKDKHTDDYDDGAPIKYSGYYGSDKKKDDYTKNQKQQYDVDNLHHGYPGYYEDGKKKDDYTEKDQDDEHEDDDLYEKFVRERFGKRGSFEKRSENLRDARAPAPAPIVANAKLFDTLQQVLKKTEQTEREAEKSGDPNAAYMWTLEYGQKL